MNDKVDALWYYLIEKECMITAGASSPDDVRKMMALRDCMRPSDPKRSHRPTSAQYGISSPSRTPSCVSHSPSSVRSCPVPSPKLSGTFLINTMCLVTDLQYTMLSGSTLSVS